ncbi:MAG: 16S rRNA (cytosine(967)-C(5))-methyltransferase RsmB [Alphaproteobacteria bacterium]|jgi:16S rRNA (cytosine967-C5)-methyltransferase|nr:16S rRNA (cytosine(967)-C(5))-methyltransferase RsmB [Alphaproteobacteria bacterium]
MTEVSRVVAAQILKNCINDKKSLIHAINSNSKYAKLKQNDKNFAMLLVNECLRHMGQLDVVINKFLANPKRVPIDIMYVLRVAAAEHFFAESPDYAVVNNAVNATQFMKKTKLKGLVNAVVRKICKIDNLNNIDVSQNFPKWLVESWTKQYGIEKTKSIMEYSLKRYPLYINVKSNPDKWEKELEAEVVYSKASSKFGSLLKCRDSMNVPNASGFSEGEWWVQGFESSLPARLLGDIKSKRVLDCCAAPGGKTAQLANARADVIAIDKNNKRLKILSENMERLNFDVKIEEADATKYEVGDFDAILIDAPCSATGTIRKNPDALYFKKPQQIKDLVILQKDILNNNSKLLKVGGTMVYSTCSLQKEEGEEQIKNFLDSNKNFELLPVKPEEVEGLSSIINKEGMIRIIPSDINEHISSDGFFIARLKRIK